MPDIWLRQSCRIPVRKGDGDRDTRARDRRLLLRSRMGNPVRDFVKVSQHSTVLVVGRAKETISRQLTTHTGNKAARRAQEMGSM